MLLHLVVQQWLYLHVCPQSLVDSKKILREPGIEPGPTPWQGAILPLDHSRGCIFGGARGPGRFIMQTSRMNEVCRHVSTSPRSLMDKALAS